MAEEQEAQTDNPQVNSTLLSVHDSMLDGLGQLADYFGFSKVMGQLYGTLLLSPEPLSLDAMMARLDISKASVSTNMRSLEHMGMVRQVWVRGGNGRRKYYEAETDFWEVISSLFSGREMRDVARAIDVIEENKQKLATTMPQMATLDQEVAELYVERMTQIQAMFRFAQLIVTTILNQAGETDFAGITSIEIE